LSISCNFKNNNVNVNELYVSFNKLTPLFQYACTDPAAIKVVAVTGGRVFYFTRSRLTDEAYVSFGNVVNFVVKSPHPVPVTLMAIGGGGGGGAALNSSENGSGGGGAGALCIRTVNSTREFGYFIKHIGTGGGGGHGNGDGAVGTDTMVTYGSINYAVLPTDVSGTTSTIRVGGGGGGGGGNNEEGRRGALPSTYIGSTGGAGGKTSSSTSSVYAHATDSTTNSYPNGTIYVNNGGNTTNARYDDTPKYLGGGGGGGGAGGAGGNGTKDAGNGGAALLFDKDGKYYAGGGAGGKSRWIGNWATGGGGGAGNNNGDSATANTGSGGAAGTQDTSGGSGANGIVAIYIDQHYFKKPNTKYFLRFNYGANYYTSTIYASSYNSTSDIYCSNRTFIWDYANTAATILIVGGGGGGGCGVGYEGGGGGGGGGVVTGYIPLIQGVSYTITVGPGGTGSSTTSGNKGTDSSISWTHAGSTNVITAYGGGGGSVPRSGKEYYANGGSGGGSGAAHYYFGSGEATRGAASGDIANRNCLAFWGNEGEFNHESSANIGGGGGGGALQRAWTPIRDYYLGYYYTGHDGGEGLTWLDDNVYGSGGGGGVGVVPEYGAYYFGGLGGTNAGSGAGQSDRDKIVGYGDGTLTYDPSRLYTSTQMKGVDNYGGGGGGGNGATSGSLSTLMPGGNGGSGRVIIAPIDYHTSQVNYWNLNSPS
jgi:hypothetical protein